MARVASPQPDLFTPVPRDLFAPCAPEPAPKLDPLRELRTLLDKVQTASVLPWQDAAAAMAEEHRALWLAKQAGDEGAKLAAAIFEQTERLFSAAE
jgi:hypothetical protein